MSQRIRSLTLQGKDILVIDLTDCSAAEVTATVRAVPDYVTSHALASVRILTDFTGAVFDDEAVRATKESAVFDKPYVKKSAWIGVDALPPSFREDISSFARREFPVFTTRKEALEWLEKD